MALIRELMRDRLIWQESLFNYKEMNDQKNQGHPYNLATHLQKYNREKMLEQLDQVYSKKSSQLDSALIKMQLMSLATEDW